MNNQLCIYCDQPVHELTADDKKTWGRETPVNGFKHDKDSSGGVVNCRRTILAEHETYTLNEVDPSS